MATLNTVIQRCLYISQNLGQEHTVITVDQEIQDALESALAKGQVQLDKFVVGRFIEKSEPFHSPTKRNHPLTFADLYKVEKKATAKGKTVVLKADRHVMQRVVSSYAAGRNVNLEKIMEHELMPVPLSLAEANGRLRRGDKSVLIHTLTKDITCPSSIPITQDSTIIIDMWATIHALGKPEGANDFGDLATAFIKAILKIGQNYQRIDLVGDQYRQLSIKSETRKHRKKNKVPIRKLVRNGTVPLPVDWGNYLTHPENKRELSIFLMDQVLERVEDKMIVISGAFKDTDDVRSTLPLHVTTILKGNHEEADIHVSSYMQLTVPPTP